MRKPRLAGIVLLGVVPLGAQQPGAWTPAEEVNRELPKWLRFSGEYRMRVEGFTAAGFREGSEDAYWLNRVRLNLKVQPREWLNVFVQGQDVRAWWRNQEALPGLAKDAMDLRQGYLELGDADNKAFGLRLGRQEINLGDQRLVGSTNWANAARTFDAVKATARGGGLKLEAFAASVVVVRHGEFNRHVDGDNIHGLYGTIETAIPQATLEPYLLWRLAPGRRTEAGEPAKLDSKTFGVRWVGTARADYDYVVQIARQAGSLGSDDVRAWAGRWMLGYTWNGRVWTPRASVDYNYGSGDADPRDGKRGTFDILYPTAHGHYGLADQVGWRNIHDLRLGVEGRPHGKVRLALDYHSWWRASLQDGLYNSGGALLVRGRGPADGRHVGQELDLQAFFAVNPRIQIAGGIGHIFPGTFLKRASPGASYTFPYVMLGYNF